MVGDIVDGASQWDFSDWPRGIVGQIGGQDAYPQLTLWENTYTHILKTVQSNRNKMKEKGLFSKGSKIMTLFELKLSLACNMVPIINTCKKQMYK